MTEAPRPRDLPAWTLGLPVFLVFAYLLVRPLGMDDYFFHARSGEYFFSTGAVLKENLYSFTAPRFPWINHSWGSGVLFFAFTRALGVEGVRALHAGLFLLAAWLFYRCIFDRVGRPWVRSIFMVAFALLGLQYEAIRPWTFSNVLFVAELLLLRPAFEPRGGSGLGRGTSARLALCLPLLLLWTNVHGSYPVGLFVYGLALCAARDRWTPAFALAAAAIPFATPNGVEGFLLPLRFIFVYGWKGVSSPVLAIEEWQSLWPPRTPLLALRLASVIGLVATIACSRFWRRKEARPWDKWIRGTYVLATTVLALQAQRQLFYLVTGCAVLFAAEIESTLGRLGDRVGSRLPLRSDPIRGRDWMCCSLALGLAAVAATRPWLDTLKPRFWPPGLIRHIAENRERYATADKRTYWDFDLANIAISRPELGQKVFYDGREYGYPPEVTRDFYAIHYGELDQLKAVARKWKIRYLVLSKGDGAELRIARSARQGVDYRILYEDRWAEVVELL